jgi:hypothetical protein
MKSQIADQLSAMGVANNAILQGVRIKARNTILEALEIHPVPEMAPGVVSVQVAGQLALQLDRYRAIRDLVRRQVLGRIGGQRHNVSHD